MLVLTMSIFTKLASIEVSSSPAWSYQKKYKYIINTKGNGYIHFKMIQDFKKRIRLHALVGNLQQIVDNMQ